MRKEDRDGLKGTRPEMAMREVHTARPAEKFGSIGAFLNVRARVHGAVEIDLGGLPLHFFYDWRESDTTFVSFSGAASAKVKHVPAWAGDGISRRLGVNRVLISDPSVILSTDLRLAWYAGNTLQPMLQQDLVMLIAGIVAGTRTILFGPSGGGFAALLYAAALPGAVAVVSNPQTDISRYQKVAVDRYMAVAWGMPSLDPARPPFRHEVLSLYRQVLDVDVVYVQNAGDTNHIDEHYRPFRDIAHKNRVEYLLPYLGLGHVGPDRDSFICLLETVRDHSDWGALTAALHRIALTRKT